MTSKVSPESPYTSIFKISKIEASIGMNLIDACHVVTPIELLKILILKMIDK